MRSEKNFDLLMIDDLGFMIRGLADEQILIPNP
jgi:hypothetical protein